MNEGRLRAILEGFPGLRVLVLGDFFLDKYLEIERKLSETSLETGLEAYQVTAVRPSPGAAGTVVSNLRALGAQVLCLGITGDTGEGYELRRCLEAIGADLSLLLVRPDLLTPTYTKPMMHEPDGRVHELQRLDIKNRAPLPGDVEEALIARLRRATPQVDAVIVSEYVQEHNCGAITDRVRQAVGELGSAYPNKVFTADSRTRIELYWNVTIKSNLSEVRRAFGLAEGEESPAAVRRALGEFVRQNSRPAFVTLGPQGMIVCDGEGAVAVPTVRTEGPVDPVGAGDSALAGITLALAAGAGNEEAALVGNLAAAVTIRKIGTTGTASPEEILERFAHLEGDFDALQP